MSYYPTEEEEFELLCNDEMEIEKELEQGMFYGMYTRRNVQEVNFLLCLHLKMLY